MLAGHHDTVSLELLPKTLENRHTQLVLEDRRPLRTLAEAWRADPPGGSGTQATAAKAAYVQNVEEVLGIRHESRRLPDGILGLVLLTELALIGDYPIDTSQLQQCSHTGFTP